jgi:hypothetical protein
MELLTLEREPEIMDKKTKKVDHTTKQQTDKRVIFGKPQ